MEDKEKYHRAKQKVEELKGFYSHLLAFLFVNVFLAVLNILTSPGTWWFLFVTFFWGIGLIAHALSVFSKRGLFTKDWEEKKLKQYLEEDD